MTYDSTLYSSAKDQRIDEAVSELFEQNDPTDLASVHQALYQGDVSRTDIPLPAMESEAKAGRPQ